MKKLIVAMVMAVMAVASANALTINWSGNALDKSGNYLNGGTAYLVQLAGDSLAASWDGTSWKMNGDTIVDSSTIFDSSMTSSTGYYVGMTDVSTAANTVYAVVVSSNGTSGSLPTSGYYGVGYFTQTKEPTAVQPEKADLADITTSIEIVQNPGPVPPPPPIPEPTTYALIGVAAAALALRKRFMKK